MGSRLIFRRLRPFIPLMCPSASDRRAISFGQLFGFAAGLGAAGLGAAVRAERGEGAADETSAVLERAREVLRRYYEEQEREIAAEAPTSVIRRKVKAEELFTPFEADSDIRTEFLIIGGGTAAYGALGAILGSKPYAKVLVVTEEKMFPYNRTPLSKEVWRKGFANAEDLEYTYRVMGRKEGGSGVLIAKGIEAVGLDLERKTVKLSTGVEVRYEKLLLATGATPKTGEALVPGMEGSELVATLRTLDDYKSLKEAADQAKHITIVGGGFLGTELAIALNGSGVKTTLTCPEPGVLYQVLPRYMSEYLGRKMSAAGVDLRVSTVVGSVRSDKPLRTYPVQSTAEPPAPEKADPVSLQLGVFGSEDGKMLTERVVVCVGVEPRVELGRRAGLEIDEENGGIRVDRCMRADENVYAAGDVASFWDRTLGRRRVEHWDNALVSGKIAGDNMVGKSSKHSLLSMFWSDLSPIGVSFEAVGLTDSNLETVGVWQLRDGCETPTPDALTSYDFESGVIWYLKNERIVGALLWNTGGKHNLALARKVILEAAEVSKPEDLKSVIPLPSKDRIILIKTPALTR